jgi:hypothetical protein
VICEQFGLSSGPDAGSLDDVLETVGNAVEWAPRAVAQDLGLGRLGLPPGEIGGECDEAMQLVIERADPLQIRLGQLHRRQFAPGNPARGLRDGYEVRDLLKLPRLHMEPADVARTRDLSRD